ncbi:MAG: phospholipase D family protein [Lysobacterales bacterium]|nr:MAG: phospholipase D family protein [Xanthomonadales bacterium]
MIRLGHCVLLALLAALFGCAPSLRVAERAQAQAERLKASDLEAKSPVPSPLFALAQADRERHRALLIERGEEALLLRLHLIRAARETIDLQTYIFADDASGRLLLAELLAAAQRGVRVRLLVDQLFSLPDEALLAGLAISHRGFSIRLYNPTFRRARTSAPEFAAGILCCFQNFNRRMHNKLLVVDGLIALIGGRNVENRYFDWDPAYNFRDREVLLSGPAVREMEDSFTRFWEHPVSHPAERLGGVAERILRGEVAEPDVAVPSPWRERGAMLRALADDPPFIARHFAALFVPVERIEYFSDRPGKPWGHRDPAARDFTSVMKAAIGAAREEVLLQTPYLVLSRQARRLFAKLADRPEPPALMVSTNSLAATDAFFVYALSHKYKRLYLRRLKLAIFEWKPFAEDAPPYLAGLSFLRGALGAKPPMPRVGLHAKTLIIDRRSAIIGSHNFTPRSADINTENGVLIEDARFVARLRETILRDMRGENAWRIARRERLPVLGSVSALASAISESLPLFDLWPWRYATSYEKRPGCPELEPGDPGFAQCYRDVGAFPEAPLPLKRLPTLLVTAFGIGLEPIL